MKKSLLLLPLVLFVCSVAHGQASCAGSSALKKHIYNPDRLTDGKGCVTVKGTIIFKKFEPDGDIHYRLKLATGEDASLVNAKNIQKALVVEPICVAPIKPKSNGKPNKPALAACKNFHQKITIPNKGDKVEVTGIHMLDTQHGWFEIHPVTSIEVIH